MKLVLCLLTATPLSYKDPKYQVRNGDEVLGFMSEKAYNHGLFPFYKWGTNHFDPPQPGNVIGVLDLSWLKTAPPVALAEIKARTQSPKMQAVLSSL